LDFFFFGVPDFNSQTAKVSSDITTNTHTHVQEAW